MKRTLSTIIAACLIAATLISPAIAAEAPVGCATVTIEWDGEQPWLIDSQNDEGVNTAIVGTFLWIQYLSDGSSDSWDNVVSVELTEGVTSYSTCTTLHDIEGPNIEEAATVEAIDEAGDAVPVIYDVAAYDAIEEANIAILKGRFLVY